MTSLKFYHKKDNQEDIKKNSRIFFLYIELRAKEPEPEPVGAGCFWPLGAGAGAGAAWKKNEEPEPEPEPVGKKMRSRSRSRLKKKRGAGAGAEKKFAGSSALPPSIPLLFLPSKTNFFLLLHLLLEEKSYLNLPFLILFTLF